jgi:squalene-associated FAD-dependent desaturase
VTLAEAGLRVTLLERATTLGGRARRVAHDGIAVDNGQHLLTGAYRQTLELIARVHEADGVAGLFHRLPLTLRPFGAHRPDSVALTAWSAPGPLHLAGGVLAARGLTWGERVALILDFRRIARSDFRRAAGETVAQCFAGTPRRAFDAVWGPLCLAALNTPPDRASAQVFARVLRAAFSGRARDSDFLVPAVDLSACFPDAAARFVGNRGGSVRVGASVGGVARCAAGIALRVGKDTEVFGAAVVAVGPHQLAATIGVEAAGEPAWGERLAQVGALAYESITTIYIGFAAPVPFAIPMLRLDDSPGQWAFDRSAALGRGSARGAQNLVAVVISAGGPHDALEQSTLAAQAEAQLRRLAPGLPAVAWTRVFAERRATYACTPALARPAAGRVSPGVYLAGDYTDSEFPATLEAATRSGVAAARALIADRRRAPPR